MNILELTPYLALAISLITLATLVKNNLTSGEKQLGVKVADQEKKLIEHDRRIQNAENDIKHLPDRETAHKLELNLEKLTSQVMQMNERIKPIAATNERMMELLLEQAK
jgi:peptidoglycan hydrolase CwlO-like protein